MCRSVCNVVFVSGVLVFALSPVWLGSSYQYSYTTADTKHNRFLIEQNGPEIHAELVDKLQKTVKITNKNLQSVLKELAVGKAKTLVNISPKPKYFCLHRPEADSEFMNTFIRETNDSDIMLFLTVGDDKGAGQMVLNGNPGDVAHLGPLICNLLEGKGAGKGTKFQAKVNNLKKINEAVKLIENHFLSLEAKQDNINNSDT